MVSAPARPLRREILNRLLPTLAVVTAPQLIRLPLWLTAAAVLFGGGCYLINMRRLAAPGMVLRTVLSLLLPLAVLNHYGTLLGRDAGSALLVVRELREDRVERVGLKFTGLGERLISGDKR